jgi:hypothetical protein
MSAVDSSILAGCVICFGLSFNKCFREVLSTGKERDSKIQIAPGEIKPSINLSIAD